MWLLPVFAPLASAALRVFYRLSRTGGEVPRGGPVLLVANHPNSLLDPAAVVAAAERPVRFLAKAPLFSDPLVGWLVRGAGAIPVFRRQDDPAAMGNNEDTFRRVHEALAGGSAVGIFPEGISHSEPALAPLRTGAARIALGAAPDIGGAFPIVPIGLVFREKETFRTEALILVGEPVGWDDLAGRGEEDAEAVRVLTDRIDAALRTVTVNLERWEDERLVETAVAVHAAEIDPLDSPAERVARLRGTTAALARLRAGGGEWREMARALTAHARALAVLGMTPEELRAGNRADVAARWILRQGAFFGLGLPIAAAGVAVYALPYGLTALVASRMRPTPDVRGTVKVLAGGVVHTAWTLLLASLAALRWGAWAGLLAVVALPLIGWSTVHVLERFRRATGETQRFLLRERRRGTLRELRARQRTLAERLHALWLAVR